MKNVFTVLAVLSLVGCLELAAGRGAVDSGSSFDAGLPDSASALDAGQAGDAGPAVDSGAPADAGPAPDAGSTALDAGPAGQAGSIVTLGTQSLADHLRAVRAASAEGLAAAEVRMLPLDGYLHYCGAVMRGDRYLSLGIGGGHSGSYDDGLYEFDLQTSQWVTRLTFSTYGTTSATINTFGEYASAPPGWERPADQHSNSHLVAVDDDVIQAHGYSIGWAARGSTQAHRWRAVTGQWERYGTLSGAQPLGTAFCFYEGGRDRLVRIPGDGNTPAVDTMPAHDGTAGWTPVSLPIPAQNSAGLYKGVGYHPGVDAYVLVSPHDYTPTTRVFVMNAADLARGWVEASASGEAMPASANWLFLEYVPPMNAFAVASIDEPDALYFLKPSATANDPWVWSRQTFSGSTPPAPWDPAGPNNRVRWNNALQGLVVLKSVTSLIEVWTPRDLLPTDGGR